MTRLLLKLTSIYVRIETFSPTDTENTMLDIGRVTNKETHILDQGRVTSLLLQYCTTNRVEKNLHVFLRIKGEFVKIKSR